MAVGEGDPKTVGTERVEVPHLAHAIPGFAEAAPLSHQGVDDAIPVATQAEFMRDGAVAEMQLSLLYRDTRPAPCLVKLDVANLLGCDLLQHAHPLR